MRSFAQIKPSQKFPYLSIMTCCSINSGYMAVTFDSIHGVINILNRIIVIARCLKIIKACLTFNLSCIWPLLHVKLAFMVV